MARTKLNEGQIAAGLEALSGWSVDGVWLKKSYKFENFAESLTFVNEVGGIAEDADHHPDIKFGWGYADIELTTHDTGGLTHNDFEVAERIDSIR